VRSALTAQSVRENTASKLRSSHASKKERESCILAARILIRLTIADLTDAETDSEIVLETGKRGRGNGDGKRGQPELREFLETGTAWGETGTA